MKSLKRGSRLITLMISVFIIGMIVLIAKIQMEASFYISNSGSRNLGYIYDRNGDIIFDDNAENGQYPDGYFKDLGNLIGDASGQMTNTLVAKNIEIKAGRRQFIPLSVMKPTKKFTALSGIRTVVL